MRWIFGVKFVNLGDSCTVGGDPAMNIIIVRVPVLNVSEYVKSIAPPLERMLGSNPPIRTVYFPLLSINIDQIPLIRGMFIGQIRSNPHLLPVGW